MNPAQRAIRNAQRTVARHAGLYVTYSSDGHEVTIWRAVPAAVSAEVLTEEEFAIRGLLQDWLIGTDELVYGGAARKPKQGDRISVLDDRGTRVYEVLPLGGSRSHYEPADAYGLQWRVHSKLIKGSI